MALGLSCVSGTTRHFETGRFKSHASFLPDDEYARVLDNVVKACADVLVYVECENNSLLVLLGHRIVFPQPDWWFVGGRLKPGERPCDGPGRLLTRELGFYIAPERLQTVGAYSFVWGLRAQQPQEHGTADISVVQCVAITAAEKDSIQLDDKEYDGMQWIEPLRIINDRTAESAYDGNFKYHPALRQSVSDWLALRAWRQLASEATALAAAPLDSAAVASLGGQFLTFVSEHAKPETFDADASLVSSSAGHHDSTSLLPVARCLGELDAVLSASAAVSENVGAKSVAFVCCCLVERLFGCGGIAGYAANSIGAEIIEQLHGSADNGTEMARTCSPRDAWLLARLLWAENLRDGAAGRQRPNLAYEPVRKQVASFLSVAQSPNSDNPTKPQLEPETVWAACYLIACGKREDASAAELDAAVSTTIAIIGRTVTTGDHSSAFWCVVMCLMAAAASPSGGKESAHRLLDAIVYVDASDRASIIRLTLAGRITGALEKIPYSDYRAWASTTAAQALAALQMEGAEAVQAFAEQSIRETTCTADRLLSNLLLRSAAVEAESFPKF